MEAKATLNLKRAQTVFLKAAGEHTPDRAAARSGYRRDDAYCSRALIICREAGVKPEMVVQIVSDERWPLPAASVTLFPC